MRCASAIACAKVRPHGYFVVGHSVSLLGQQLERIGEVVGVYKAPAGIIHHHLARVPHKVVRQGVPGLPIKRIVLGQWHASSSPVLISTLLGSCVRAKCCYARTMATASCATSPAIRSH
jgi:hypothetical protein